MPKFTSIGNPEHFTAIDEYFQSDSGFLYTDQIGGPSAADYLAKTFEAREDDVVVASFPKTGTTWIQELVYLIVSDLDFEKANTVKLTNRYTFMELIVTSSDVKDLPSPRFLKFHYSYSMLPQTIIDKKCKIVVPIRNPKDTCVSYYFFSLMNKLYKFTGDLETFVDLFVNDKVLFGPFWKHVLEYWEKSKQFDNVFVVSYEEMNADIYSVIRKLVRFFGKNFSDHDIDRIVEHCSFENMKNNPTSNPDLTSSQFMMNDKSVFMRKGKVGDWKNHLTEDMSKKIDDYVEKHFKDSNLKFVYEL